MIKKNNLCALYGDYKTFIHSLLPIFFSVHDVEIQLSYLVLKSLSSTYLNACPFSMKHVIKYVNKKSNK